MTILNTYAEPGEILALWFMMILLGLIAGVYCWADYNTTLASVLATFLVVGVLGCIFWTPFETRYECLFDKGTSYTEISEHWNVVEQRGDIWVVTAKEGADATDTAIR